MFGIKGLDDNIVSHGLLEMRLGGDRPMFGIGMGGTDVSLGTLTSAFRGFDTYKQSRRIANSSVDEKFHKTLRSQYSREMDDVRLQYEDILAGGTVLRENKTQIFGAVTMLNSDGQRVVSLNTSVGNDLDVGVLLAHEAFRDGVNNGAQGQRAETDAAAMGHMKVAAELLETYGAGALNSMNTMEAQAFMYAMEQRDMGMIEAYVQASYDDSSDFLKLMEDGSLIDDGDGWLKDSNDNYILDENGERIGAATKQSGLQNILGISSGQAVAMMQDAGFALGGDGVWWNLDENLGRSITLDNDLYASIYDENLSQHNTLNIYNSLVESEIMDLSSEYKDYMSNIADIMIANDISATDNVTDLISQLRRPENRFIGYDEYKQNNFISNVANILVMNEDVVGDARISAAFGLGMLRGKPRNHSGIDYDIPEGTPISPYMDGSVLGIGETSYGGNTLTLQHRVEFMFKGQMRSVFMNSEYLHLRDNQLGQPDVRYQQGASVSINDVVAYSGNTGDSTGPHLHGGTYFPNKNRNTNPLVNYLYLNDINTVEWMRGLFFNPYDYYGRIDE